MYIQPFTHNTSFCADDAYPVVESRLVYAAHIITRFFEVDGTLHKTAQESLVHGINVYTLFIAY